MPYQPQLVKGGWGVMDCLTRETVTRTGGYGPEPRELAATTALLLDALVEANPPTVSMARYHQEPDQHDYSIAVAWARVRIQQSQEIQAGDVVRLKDGTLRRVAHVWPDGYQPTGFHYGSFALGNGYASYADGLDPLEPFPTPTDEIMPVEFWFPHHNRLEAGSGVLCKIPVRVWQEA